MPRLGREFDDSDANDAPAKVVKARQQRGELENACRNTDASACALHADRDDNFPAVAA